MRVPVFVRVRLSVVVRMLVGVCVVMGMRMGMLSLVGMPVRMPLVGRCIVGLAEPEFGGRHSGAEHAFGIHAPILHRETPQGRPEIVERQPQIEQPAEDHVA